MNVVAPTRSAARSWLHRMVAVGSAPGAGWVALRAGVALGVPLTVLAATGHTELTIYATFGAFTAVYGREAARHERVAMQTRAGIWLTVCVATGAAVGTASAREWIVIPVAAAVCAAGAVGAAVWAWAPPCPLFAVFAVAGCASIASTPDRIVAGTLVAAAAAALSVVTGVAGHAGHPTTGAPRRPHVPQAVDLGRHALAVAVAGLIPTAAGWGHPYWAIVAAVAATSGADTSGRVTRGAQRILGTLIGVLITAAVLATDPAVAVVIAVAVGCQMITELLVGRNYALALIFVTPLAILMIELGSPQQPGSLLRDRALETLVGGLVGIAASLLLSPRGRTRRLQ